MAILAYTYTFIGHNEGLGAPFYIEFEPDKPIASLVNRIFEQHKRDWFKKDDLTLYAVRRHRLGLLELLSL